MKTEAPDSEIWFGDDQQESNGLIITISLIGIELQLHFFSLDKTHQVHANIVEDTFPEKPLSVGHIAILATLSALILSMTLAAIVILVRKSQNRSSAVRHIR